ncbi:MAG: OmpA family protein [Cytophagaceae bacterium]|jgi:outer membrane protein OmpA-like peptidoglycan-associated protein|nr:OmpA family protein [Cytophagaceae bacterium]
MVGLRWSFFVFFIWILTSTFAWAQDEKQLIKEAENALKNDKKEEALALYLKAHAKNPSNALTNYQIGTLYIKVSNTPLKSLPYLEKAFQLNSKVKDDLPFFLGLSYQMNLKFDEAIQTFTQYRSTIPTSDPRYKKISRYIEECQTGKTLVAQPVPVKVENLGNLINGEFFDFAPVISADEQVMIFTSRRPGSLGVLDPTTGMYNEDIYISTKVNGKWSTPKNMGSVVNTENHDASIGLSADGKTLFIYRDGTGLGDIYFCTRTKDDTWSKPRPIEGEVNNRNFNEKDVAISPDNSLLFFSSNRDGGFGGLDIYMVQKDQNGFWGKPVNLGPEINTAEDEAGPFMDFDGRTLYFSSKAHEGMGGFDIFQTVFDSTAQKWTKPLNLGYPINTPFNDIYFVLSGDGSHGYYAASREDSYGQLDIYRISMPPRKDRDELIKKMMKMNLVVEEPKVVEPIATTNTTVYPVRLKGVIKDAASGLPIAAQIQLTDAKGVVVSSTTTTADGLYSFEISNSQMSNYTITGQKNGYSYDTKSVSIPANGPNRQELTQNLAIKKLEVGNVFVLRNIYFDFDQSTIKSESERELQILLKMLQDNPSLKIEIGGHTDSKGSDSYNESLSKRRAQAVVQWLVNKGISRDRLSAKGYGESTPLASNDDEEDGREINRRTEFKIIQK